MPKSVFVTGSAGFIGFHFTKKLLALNYQVVGYDNVNDYYDVSIKEARLSVLRQSPHFTFVKGDLKDLPALQKIFSQQKFDYVVNLAAQAGVRYSITNPQAYLDSNVHGFLNILEICRHHNVSHLVYASSSSVYGANTSMPFSVRQNVDHPLSLYAAFKKANELMAHSYSVLYHLPTTGLRFFNVYGPFGRPDMALFHFTQSILESKPIDVYNYGKMKRDFTYVDDIAEGIARVMPHIPAPDSSWNGNAPNPSTSFAPFKLYNIGNHSPVELLYFIELIEKKLNRKAILNLMPLQEGDVPNSFADVEELINDVGFAPNTPIEKGVSNFVDWYLDFYHIN
ncbi:MAG: NAD-dependent epimerase [Bacteroidetes bacterium]|nr:NAD-dependent epimerase [Bacteroidota bacterium]MBS1539930.1 NAD-dependent epimerase [Bacteroidota bacterium]